MGKGGRIACIFAPMSLTVASFLALTFCQISGWHSNPLLDPNFLMHADFGNLSVATSNGFKGRSELAEALSLASMSGKLEDTYRIYLWNYCSGGRSSGEATHRESRCSERQSSFIFDPVGVFGLNTTSSSRQPDNSNKTNNTIVTTIDAVKDDLKNLETKVLGGAASRALSIYRRVARWNFIAYQCAFWTTLVTIIIGLVAICSRWGSLFTWITAVVGFDHPLVHVKRVHTYVRLDCVRVHLSIFPSVNDTFLFLGRYTPHTPQPFRRQNHRWYTCLHDRVDRFSTFDHRHVVLARFRVLLLWPQQSSSQIEKRRPLERGAGSYQRSSMIGSRRQ